MSLFRQGVQEAGLILLAACVLGFSYTATSKKGIFAEAREKSAAQHSSAANSLPMIGLDEARSLFENGQALFIDARHEFDYKLGHIKGAINIPLNEYDAKKSILAEYAKEKIIIAYCDGAECNSSIELAARLFADGFTSVKIFFGGWREWSGGQLPVEQSSS